MKRRDLFKFLAGAAAAPVVAKALSEDGGPDPTEAELKRVMNQPIPHARHVFYSNFADDPQAFLGMSVSYAPALQGNARRYYNSAGAEVSVHEYLEMLENQGER